jgi:predicted permease
MRLVRQMLIESLTLALAGAAAGLAVARLAMSAIVVLGAGRIPRLAALSLDPRLIGVALGIATLSAVLFGLAPALRAARTEPGEVLRDQARSATGGARQVHLRESLVVAQVALAFVLLVGAGLLLASFQRLRQVDLGVTIDHVLSFEIHLPEARYDSTARARFHETFAKTVEALPGVRSAGGVSRLPATGSYHWWGTMATTGTLAHDERGQSGGEQRVVSGDYFHAVGIPLLEGRLFDARDDAAAPDRVIISRSLAARLFPGVDAVGQQVSAAGRESEIIGVVGEVAVDGEGREDAYVYHPHRQYAGDRNWALAQVVATAGSAAALVPEVRRRLAELDPGLVLYRPMLLADAIGRGAAARVFTLRVLLTFAGLALALSALGLFGVLSYGVKLRSREFAIRMALGAEPGRIRRIVLRQGLTLAAIGIGAGLLGALALSRLMATMLFQVSPLDPLVLLGAVGFLAVVAGVAAYLPAHRATAIDPRFALQQQ